MLGLDALVNVANVIYLLSYSVRDILWLRILTVFGAGLLLPYYYLQLEPLWAPMVWNVIFISINIYWITRLIMERRPVQFTEDEQRLYESSLRNMTKHQAKKIFLLGEWTTAPVGARPLEQGKPVEAVSLIAEGEVTVEMDGDLVDTIGAGCFLGANAFLHSDEGFGAPVTVMATQPTRIITWPRTLLRTEFDKDPDLAIAFQASLGLEIAHYLRTARVKLLALRPA